MPNQCFIIVMPMHRKLGARHSAFVVDDDVDVAGFAFMLMEDLSFQVKLAHRADSALEMLRQAEKVELLFCDIATPGGMDGVALAEEARRILSCSPPAAAMLSAKAGRLRTAS